MLPSPSCAARHTVAASRVGGVDMPLDGPVSDRRSKPLVLFPIVAGTGLAAVRGLASTIVRARKDARWCADLRARGISVKYFTHAR